MNAVAVEPVASGMRAIVVGARLTDDSMEEHVINGLQRLGVEVHFVASSTYVGNISPTAERVAYKIVHTLLREPERLVESRLLRAVANFQPQLILVLLGNQLSPRSLQKIRKITRSPIVAWCQDALSNLGRQNLLGAHYDFVFLKDRYLVDLFSRMLALGRFLYLPEACNPEVHRSVHLSADDRRRYGCDVMIAGSMYYYRQEILESLRNFNVRVWGPQDSWFVNRLGDFHMGRPVFGLEKAKAARGASIALNTLHFAEIDSLNCRAFELAGCGAFQMITANNALQRHFVPGVEIETFRSTSELVEKARYYLAHPDSAKEIAAAGQRRAFSEHTYQHRLTEILRTVGLVR